MLVSEVLFVAASVADIASTYYGVEHKGLREQNPVSVAFGEDAATVALTNVVLTVLAYLFFRAMRQRAGDVAVNWILYAGASLRFMAAGWNFWLASRV